MGFYSQPQIAVLKGDRLEFCQNGMRCTFYVLYVCSRTVTVSGFRGGVTYKLPRAADGSIVLDPAMIGTLIADAAECEPIDIMVSE